MRRDITRERFKERKQKYPKGTRVELINMDDPQAPPIGTMGTIKGVDDSGEPYIHIDIYGGSKILDHMEVENE